MGYMSTVSHSLAYAYVKGRSASLIPHRTESYRQVTSFATTSSFLSYIPFRIGILRLPQLTRLRAPALPSSAEDSLGFLSPSPFITWRPRQSLRAGRRHLRLCALGWPARSWLEERPCRAPRECRVQEARPSRGRGHEDIRRFRPATHAPRP